MSTVFTKIIKREISSSIIYEDNDVIAFLDISQITRGHTLVVPKKEYRDIFEIDEETLSKLILVVKKVATNIKERLKVKGVNIFSNNGEVAGQVVNHLHFHVIPRYSKEELKFVHKDNSKDVSKSSLEVLRLLLKF